MAWSGCVVEDNINLNFLPVQDDSRSHQLVVVVFPPIIFESLIRSLELKGTFYALETVRNFC
jgi:hypothetical protein